MSGFWKWALIILAILYFLSPIDMLPDFLHPLIGRLDDLFIFIALILYYYYGINLLKWFMGRNAHHHYQNRYQNQFGGNENQKVGEDRQTPLMNPYQILGVLPEARPEEIKKAYREASQKYHPDKVSHLGHEFQELAQKKFVEIQEAYEELRRQGGW